MIKKLISIAIISAFIPIVLICQDSTDYSKLYTNLVNKMRSTDSILLDKAIKTDLNSDINLLLGRGLEFVDVLGPYLGETNNLKNVITQLTGIKFTLRSAKDVNLFQRAVISTALIVVPDLDCCGAGFIIDSMNGLIVTNFHVTKGLKNVLVAFYNEDIQDSSKLKYFPAKVIKYSAKKDVAILKLLKIPFPLQELNLGDMINIKVGEEIHTIGHPMQLTWTYSKGLITALRKNYQFGEEEYADVIQLDASISPGNSGGPLLDDNCQVIGMITFSNSSQYAQNLNFAISGKDIRNVIDLKNNEDTTISTNLLKLYDFPIIRLADVLKEYNAFGTDTNGDGKNDSFSIRDKANNKELFRYLKEVNIGDDPNKKELANILCLDLSKEKNIVIYMVDRNLDGIFECVMIDLNNDNNPDIIGVDTEGKGAITKAWIN